MQLPKTTKSRVWLAVGALTALAVIAFGITAYNLWQDGNTPSASKSKTDKNGDGIPDGPTDYPTFAGPSASTTASVPGSKIDPSKIGSGIKGVDPFASGTGDSGPHQVTITYKSDGAAYLGYQWRDGKKQGSKVMSKSFSVSRTVNGPLPVAFTGIQVLSTATYASCSISIDGVVTNSATAHGRYDVVACLS